MKKTACAVWLALALCAPPTWAADEQGAPWYEIELIVFAHADPLTRGSEQWPTLLEMPSLQYSIELRHPQSDAPPAPAPSPALQFEKVGPAPAAPAELIAPPYRLLPPEQLQLKDLAKRLERSANYRLLEHLAWRQPVLEREQALPILIRHYTPPAADAAAAVPAEPATTAPLTPQARTSMFTPWEEQPLEVADPLVDNPVFGTVTASLGRYLHLAVDLVLAEQPPQGALAQEPSAPMFYRLRESRRLRSTEVHYFDHPRFGVIAVLRPYQLPKVETPAPPAPAPVAAPAENPTRGTIRRP